MSTVTKTHATKTETPAPVAPTAPTVADKVNEEVNAQGNALSAYVKASGSIGPLGLEKLAVAMGESTNKSGRPAFGAWLAYVTALACAKPGYATQNRLAALANKHVPKEHKPVASTKAKGNVGAGACSFRINTPVAWDIAVGE